MLWVLTAAFLAAFFTGRGLVRRSAAADRLRRLCGEEHEEQPAGGDPVRRYLDAFMVLPCRMLPAPLKRWVSRGLPGVGPGTGLNVEQLTGIRIWAAAALPLSVLTLSRFSPAGFLVLPVCAAVGARLPDLVVARNRKRYLDEMRLALPHTADMLYAFVLGGRNLEQAFRGAALSSPEPLGRLMRQAVKEMDVGSSREESFARLLERCPLPELSSLLRCLTESERRGYPLSGTLEVFSREIRLKHRDHLRVAVAKAPLKILAPLVFMILPASVMLTVGPTFLTALRNGF